jgi:hypothetical protein
LSRETKKRDPVSVTGQRLRNEVTTPSNVVHDPAAAAGGKENRNMVLTDVTLAMFTLCNSLRALAYIPQIVKIAADRQGAGAVSLATWAQFLLSNASITAYAAVNKEDWTMATMFLINASGCAIILIIGVWRRTQYRNRVLTQAV